MLKIKDKEKLQEIIKKYDLEYEADSDYWEVYNYAMYYKDGIFIDVTNEDNLEIYGVDNSKLDLLYDLIKDGLVEKVE
jgi:hypothetical protein